MALRPAPSPKKKMRSATPAWKAEALRNDAGEWFEELVNLMARLRAPGGCPWDRQQTHATLRTYLIEEAYEVLDALESGEDAKFLEEMGDLLLQIVFHSQIAQEEGRFTVTDVIREVHGKMLRRHPHVFGKKRVKNAAEVLKNWEQIKKEERRAKGNSAATTLAKESSKRESLLDGVPRGLPALMEGFQITRRAARVGFDWETPGDVFDKLREEEAGIRQALSQGNSLEIEDEVGDLLFAGMNLARFLKVDPEIAMKKATAKFSRRFREMERIAVKRRTTLSAIPKPALESLWEQAKARLAKTGPGRKRRPERRSRKSWSAGQAV